MEWDTSRFGRIEIDADDMLHFPAGVFGMEECRDWAVLADPASTTFVWLQSLARPEVALAVVSPRRFVPNYQMRLARREWEPLGLDSPGVAQVLAIVGKTEQGMTLNLKAPLVINIERRLGRQVVTNGDLPLRYVVAETLPSIKISA
jgi:flagellar assembly factor FliW